MRRSKTEDSFKYYRSHWSETIVNHLQLPQYPISRPEPNFRFSFLPSEEENCTVYQRFFPNSSDERGNMYYLFCLNSCRNVQENEVIGKTLRFSDISASLTSALFIKKLLTSQEFPLRKKVNKRLVVQYNLQREKTLPVTSFSLKVKK